MGRRTRRTGSPDRSHRPASPHALLQLMWLASPALPVGGFSYSEVLEAAVESGAMTGEAQAAAWLRDQLQLALSRSELPVVAKAFKAWARGDLAAIAELNVWVGTTRESAELRQQTRHSTCGCSGPEEMKPPRALRALPPEGATRYLRAAGRY